MRAHETIAVWVAELPEPATSERVHNDLWYVRLPGVFKRWIPIEILVDQRTTKLTSHVIPEPEERLADVFRLLLRHNHEAPGVAFSLDGRESVICLVARVPNDAIDTAGLDLLAGQIVTTTEETFRSIIELGFGSRLRRSGS